MKENDDKNPPWKTFITRNVPQNDRQLSKNARSSPKTMAAFASRCTHNYPSTYLPRSLNMHLTRTSATSTVPGTLHDIIFPTCTDMALHDRPWQMTLPVRSGPS